ncbi:DUF3987 domain-containing protein [Streptomyces sp. V4I2]|uniref:DUF3987 domain-containing protein n=1 Tax=Streptomyces sp. V4I2 TaxID=3042280 RepID=UPI00278A0A46|nr:DUF3987 domain-containing protein [Streptomyces sp. V4I2]MDQ1049127.1 hypothetical protein [Streptomyces sp. V4I2]
MSAAEERLNLPTQFWDSRIVLARIREAAHARMVSPDAVLGCVLATVAACVSPHLGVDTGVDDATSLNLLVANVGPPGSSKSQAEKAVRRLMPTPGHVRTGSIGSGEGIAEIFMGERPTGEVTKQGREITERAQVWNNALLVADEGEVMSRLGERSGSVLGTTLRSAFTGGAIGQSNATRERTRHVPSGSYSFGLIAAFQPKTIRPLLDEEPQGTPQRFLYFRSVDPGIPAPAEQEPLWGDGGTEPREPSCEDDLSRAVEKAATQGAFIGQGITFPAAVTAEVRRERWYAHQGVTPAALDAHRTLLRLKVAALLLILDGRGAGAVTTEDWELASQIVDVSSNVRDDLVRQAAADRAAEGEARKIDHIDREVRTEQAKHEQKVERLAVRVRKYAAAAGTAGVPLSGRGGLPRKFDQRERGLLDEALDLATYKRWVTVTEGVVVT